MIDHEFFISVYKNHIYLINYQNIIDFSDAKAKFKINNCILTIYGREFKLVRKTNNEIDISGYFSKMELNNE